MPEPCATSACRKPKLLGGFSSATGRKLYELAEKKAISTTSLWPQAGFNFYTSRHLAAQMLFVVEVVVGIAAAARAAPPAV